MKALGCAACVLLAWTVAARGGAIDLYVAPDGSDRNPGDAARPFATLAAARDAVRRLRIDGKLPGPVCVHVQPAVYTLAAPLVLDARDGGDAASPVEYRAVAGGPCVLSGGVPIPHWSAHTGKILKADVSRLALPADCRVLVVDGRRQEIARYPNRDPQDVNGGAWAYVDGKRISMYADTPGNEDYHRANANLDFWQRNVPRLTRAMTLRPEDVRPWSRPQQGEVSIFPRFNWWHYVLPIEGLDRAQRTIRLGPGSFYEIRPGDRYFIRGVIEELDEPGEWFLDREGKTLYFWPPKPLSGQSVRAAVAANIVRLEGCSHVTLRGFALECCNGTAVVLKDCTNCTIAGNTIRNVGDREGSGVAVQGGRNNSVVGNDIHEVGAYGIELGGGDLATLACAGNSAENNYIHHAGLVGRHAKGIEITGAGNRAAHNLIHDVPQSGIYLWGTKHTVEYNRIRHTCLEGEDTGAIGGGGIDWLSWRGTAIRNNFIHDTLGFGFDPEAGRWRSPYFAWAIYVDWAAGGVEISGNILARAPTGLLRLHSGHDTKVENNIFIDGGDYQLDCDGWTTATGFWSTMVDNWIQNYLEAMKSPAWQALGALRDPRAIPLPDGRVMRDNVFRRNVFSYRSASAALLRFREAPPEHNRSDHNLIDCGGLPIRTGFLEVVGPRGGNVLADPGFEAGIIGQSPAAWHSSAGAGEGSRAKVTDQSTHSGRFALLVEPGMAPPGKSVRWVDLTPTGTAYRPGSVWRLSVWLQADGPPANVGLTLYSWKQDKHNWSVRSERRGDGQWRQQSLVVRLPKPGESEYRNSMDTLWCRLSFPAGASRFFVDDVVMEEVNAGDEWQGWQVQGMDRHSLLADPRFVDRNADDFRLQPDSPAWKLGFRPIPLERIGPYANPQRATWPIVEAAGARERLPSVAHGR